MKYRISFCIALGVFLSATLYLQGQAVQRILPLPGELAPYRSWKPQIKGPYEVPWESWIRCTSPTDADQETVRESHGPHATKQIQVYANQAAERVLKGGKSKVFPIGSIIAKEKLLLQEHGPEFSGIAFMIKRSSEKFPETGGWEFQYFPSNESEQQQIQSTCGGCHKTAPTDYVFADYLHQKR